MNGLLRHLEITLRLYTRNKMALLYGYLFPVIFFVAFLVLYRYEQPKLIQHVGELLTVSILGGACFGLPTGLVSERERGVWRRYRLAPIRTGSLVASTLIARYAMVLSAGLIQLMLCMIIGRWAPEHPFGLWVAFTFVTFAFLGLGLVLASLADTVPAVQALGQCIFLPMLIIGGVAVKLTTLPDWALHVSAFFPGRYAVETLQECVKGDGLGPMGFNLFALLLIGLAGCLAGAKLFRWDAQQHFISSGNKAWLGVALTAWAVIGIGAEFRREIAPRSERRRPVPNASVSARSTQTLAFRVPVTQTGAATAGVTPATAGAASAPDKTAPSVAVMTNRPAAPWRAYTTNDYAKFDFESLPPDDGSVAPIASETEELSPVFADEMGTINNEIETWPPGRVKDPVQRARNLIYLAGALDEARHPLERFVPAVVLSRLREDFKDEELAQILCWIAKHPEEGDDSAIGDFEQFGLQLTKPDVAEVRVRAYYYSLKFLRWLLNG